MPEQDNVVITNTTPLITLTVSIGIGLSYQDMLSKT
jgi:hypothetical protein